MIDEQHESKPQQGYSVPRLYKIGYLEVALRQILDLASFDRIRQALIVFAASQKENQIVVPKTHDPFSLWSPTQETLAELMRLNFIESASLPSERKYLDSHRGDTYVFTNQGASAVEKLRS